MKVRAYQHGKKTSAEQQVQEGPERDEQGLTVYDKWRGRQMMCATCHGRPCADRCPEQYFPDTLRLKAARAGLLAECGVIGCQGCPLCCGAWAAAHSDWVGWDLHRERADVRAFLVAREQSIAALAAQVSALSETEADGERCIPVEVAMAQAMAVVAGEARAEDVAPVYEEVP